MNKKTKKRNKQSLKFMKQESIKKFKAKNIINDSTLVYNQSKEMVAENCDTKKNVNKVEIIGLKSNCLEDNSKDSDNIFEDLIDNCKAGSIDLVKLKLEKKKTN